MTARPRVLGVVSHPAGVQSGTAEDVTAAAERRDKVLSEVFATVDEVREATVEVVSASDAMGT